MHTHQASHDQLTARSKASTAFTLRCEAALFSSFHIVQHAGGELCFVRSIIVTATRARLITAVRLSICCACCSCGNRRCCAAPSLCQTCATVWGTTPPL